MTTMHPPHPELPDNVLKHVIQLCQSEKRHILGICGAPGAGKSTLAQQLANWLGEKAAVLPMDGYHLANCQLQRLGRTERKGAPDTFDVYGYVSILQRIRQDFSLRSTYAPAFEREIEEPIAGAIEIPKDAHLVITEGNYLLLNEGGWENVAALLDECWYVDINDDLRRQRLEARHQHFGRSAEAARDWVLHTDEPNAELIASCRHQATRTITL